MIEGKIKLLYELKHLPSIEFYKYLSYIFRNQLSNSESHLPLTHSTLNLMFSEVS